MSLIYKVLLGLMVAGAIFLGGFYTGKGDKQVEIQEKIVTVKGETQVVVRDRIVTVTKTLKPDGTVVETTKTEEKQKDTTTKTTEKDKSTNVATRPVLSRYSLGLFGSMKLDKLSELPKPQLGVSAGIRTVGEVWLKSYVVPADKSIAMGIEIQF